MQTFKNISIKAIPFTWRESISFSSSYARAPSLLSPSSTSTSSSRPGRRNLDPHWREFLSGSMLITEKAMGPSCCSTPSLVARGNRGPMTRSWSARRNGGTKSSSIPERRGRPPRPHHRAQVRIPPPWRHRGTSPERRPVIRLFVEGSEESPSWEHPSSSSLPWLLLLLLPPWGKLWWRSAFLWQRWPYCHSDRHVI